MRATTLGAALLLFLALSGFAIVRQPDGPRANAVTALSVRDFAAQGDGRADDAPAIRRAIAALPPKGGTVRVPAGTYLLRSEVVINRDNVALVGDGPDSILRLAKGVQRSAIALPRTYTELGAEPRAVVRNVRIARLTIDGNKNPPTPTNVPSFFGIQLTQAERVTMSELWVRDFPFDGISIGVGNVAPKDVTIRNSRITGIGRNGIHLGFGQGLLVRQVLIEDTPSQQWGPTAGNGIDVEVEGVNPTVRDFVIEDSVIQRDPNTPNDARTTTAGAGVALQTAPDRPIVNGVIRRNVIRNHQVGVHVNQTPASSITGTVIEDNWIVGEERNQVSGHGIQILNASVRIERNVVNLLRWCCGEGAVNLQGGPQRATANRLWGGQRAFAMPLGTGELRENRWGNAPGRFSDAVPVLTSASGNEQVGFGFLDRSPPTVRFAPKSSSIAATDKGEGVARVFFYVDGIPVAFDDSAPYRLAFDPSRYRPGQHTIEAAAVDRAGNLGARVSTTITA